MNEQIILAQDIILDKANQICNKLGLNNVMVQLYIILYFSDKPLSLDDMVNTLKISKGNASVNIRALERYHAVRPVWVKGTRKDYYEAEKDIQKVILERIRSMAGSRLEEVKGILESSGSIVAAPADPKKAEDPALVVFRERLTSLKEFYDKAQAVFDMVNSGIINTFETEEKKPLHAEKANA